MKTSTMFLSNSFSQIWKLLIVLLLSFGLFMLSHGSVQASPTTCTGPSCTNVGYFWDGAFRYSSGWGAEAIIGDYQVATNCISSSTWTLIANPSYSSGTALSQDGYLRLYSWSNSTTYYFYEFGTTTYLYPPVMLSAMKKSNAITIGRRYANAKPFAAKALLASFTSINSIPPVGATEPSHPIQNVPAWIVTFTTTNPQNVVQGKQVQPGQHAPTLFPTHFNVVINATTGDFVLGFFTA